MSLNPKRTVEELKELRALTGDANGAQRLAWTDTWLEARKWFASKVESLPVEHHYDAAGNNWVTLPGASPKALLIGGHLDSVPNGGWLDGALNVVAGLEVLRRFATEFEGRPPVTVRLVDWADEEGARFGRSLLGSSAFAGTHSIAADRGRTDRDGVKLEDALRKCGVDIERFPEAEKEREHAAAYLELHIEQGPVLESMGLPLGVVLGTKGVERHTINFYGQEAHSGATPMKARQDALAAAAKLALEIRAIAGKHADAVCTMGSVAMLQIVHDVAPGAGLAFRTGNLGEADFATGIGQLAASVASGGAGAKIIADDLGYFDEPFYQDGILAQAIDAVQVQGVMYFSAAGNDGALAYDNNAPHFTTAGSGVNAGQTLLNFDTSGATNTTSLPVTLPALYPGAFVAIVVEWDQPYVTGAPNSGGATSQIDVCVNGTLGGDQITDDNLNVLGTGCTGPNALGSDPVQLLLVGVPANGSDSTGVATINIVVGLVNGGKVPGRIKVALEGDGFQLTINNFWTPSPTIQGHPSAAGAVAMGAAFFLNTAACGTSPATLEYFSSYGGDPILFDVNGNRLTTPVYRQKPDFVGPDGGNNTFLGYTFAQGEITDDSTTAGCKDNANYPNFFGTSAATPHAASIAALLLQADPTLTPAQIYTALQNSALSMGGATPNTASGYGFVQADAAYGLIPATLPAAPTLSLASSSIPVNTSTTINWSSANNQGCTGSGTWSGALASSGSQTLTPSTVGSYPYMLSCTNATGTSTVSSVTLTVTAASSGGGGGGGGGALGLATLLGLSALSMARLRRAVPTRRSSSRHTH